MKNFKGDQNKDVNTRFDNRYIPVPFSGCWIWLGATASGYGVITTRKKKNQGAHRFSYERKYGPIPDGMFVCHKCDVKECVNPEHLFLGTQFDNVKDMELKDRTKGRRAGLVRSKCKELGLNYFTVHSRLTRLGWDIEKAFSTPTGIRRNQYS